MGNKGGRQNEGLHHQQGVNEGSQTGKGHDYRLNHSFEKTNLCREWIEEGDTGGKWGHLGSLESVLQSWTEMMKTPTSPMAVKAEAKTDSKDVWVVESIT